MATRVLRFLGALSLAGWVGFAYGQTAIPLSETVNVNGKLWAQPRLFTYFSWYDVDAICPAETGICGAGSLNGFELEGWTWASVEDMNALFNAYIGSNVMMGPTELRDVGGTWAGTFLSEFEFTYEGPYRDYQGIAGWMRTTDPVFGSPLYATLVDYYSAPDFWSFADTENRTCCGAPFSGGGAWFFQESAAAPPLQVPTLPFGALWLLVLLMQAIVFCRGAKLSEPQEVQAQRKSAW